MLIPRPGDDVRPVGSSVWFPHPAKVQNLRATFEEAEGSAPALRGFGLERLREGSRQPSLVDALRGVAPLLRGAGYPVHEIDRVLNRSQPAMLQLLLRGLQGDDDGDGRENPELERFILR